MEDKKYSQEGKGWPEMGQHQKFLELCAISTSGELNDEEQRDLQAHLAECPDCRQALKEFEAAADIGMPLLHSELSARDSVEPDSVANGVANEVPSPAMQHAESALRQREPVEQNSGHGFSHRYGYRPMAVNWNYVWMPFAAAIVLTAALGIYSFQVGKQKGQELALVAPSVPDAKVDALEQRITDAGHDSQVLKAQLADRDRTIAELRRQVSAQSGVLDEMKSAQVNLEYSLKGDATEKQQAAQESSNFTRKLVEAQASLQKTQAELNSLRQQREQDLSRSEGLEVQLRDLHGQLRDREQALARQEELLDHDRDIRDLMGARDLYIAEVYDVARDGATQKPYGRLFYTKGKSLIFYAYDLDQQNEVKNASTFQAWGRRGPDRQQALALGVFFEDNISKKRWVLKLDDPRVLAQIDAVFVTVEPNGGSRKPSGKPLLFAYLRVDPNHP